MSNEAMTLALEALKDNQHLVADNERHAYVMEYNAIIEKLEEALAKQEQSEPVALNLSQFRLVALQTDHPQDKKPMEWQEAFAQGWNGMIAALEKVGPLYTTQQRKPLTDEQIEKIAKENDVWMLFRSLAIFDFVRAIEAAHGIKE